MNTERMPWTCRWSEFRPTSPAPMWMDQWMAQWVCLADRQRTGEANSTGAWLARNTRRATIAPASLRVISCYRAGA